MTPKRGRQRKVTPQLRLESQRLVESMQLQAAILNAWHPNSTHLLILTQQLTALAADLALAGAEGE